MYSNKPSDFASVFLLAVQAYALITEVAVTSSNGGTPAGKIGEALMIAGSLPLDRDWDEDKQDWLPGAIETRANEEGIDAMVRELVRYAYGHVGRPDWFPEDVG